MDTSAYIEKLIELTNKKLEALNYLLFCLENGALIKQESRETYYTEKATIEKAVFKVDIEFLSYYNDLLKIENVNAIGEIDKNKLPNVKRLQPLIEKVKTIDLRIETLELEKESEGVKPSKHTAPRAIEAYKKFKK